MKKLLLPLLIASPLLSAAAPNKITYQGRLTQSGLAASGSYNFHACFGPGGTSPCTFPKNLTLPPSGDFTFVIDVPSGVDFLNNAVQLSIFIDGNPFSPADDFVSVPYALVAGTATVALSAQSLAGSIAASQVGLDGTSAFLSSWQSTTTASMIDAADILGLPSNPWAAGAGNSLSYAGGNVGVGTASPATVFHVRQGANVNLAVSGGVQSASAVSLNAVNDAYSANIPLEIRATPAVFPAGRVGVGTTAPGYGLDVLHDDGGIGWVAKFQSVNPTNDGAVLLGSRADNSGSIQSINSAGAAQNLLINPDAGNVGVGTTNPQAKLEVAGDLIRTIARVGGLGPEDGEDSGRITSRTLPVTKRRADTGLRVTYVDNLRSLANGNWDGTGVAESACRWAIRFDGNNACQIPGDLVYDFFSRIENSHESRTLIGTCFGLSAGAHEVQIWVEGTPGYNRDCHTGWSSQYWTLEAEEVR